MMILCCYIHEINLRITQNCRWKGPWWCLFACEPRNVYRVSFFFRTAVAQFWMPRRLGIQAPVSEEFHVNFCCNLRNFGNLRNSSDSHTILDPFYQNLTKWGICLGRFKILLSKPHNFFKYHTIWGIIVSTCFLLESVYSLLDKAPITKFLTLSVFHKWNPSSGESSIVNPLT